MLVCFQDLLSSTVLGAVDVLHKVTSLLCWTRLHGPKLVAWPEVISRVQGSAPIHLLWLYEMQQLMLLPLDEHPRHHFLLAKHGRQVETGAIVEAGGAQHLLAHAHPVLKELERLRVDQLEKDIRVPLHDAQVRCPGATMS